MHHHYTILFSSTPERGEKARRGGKNPLETPARPVDLQRTVLCKEAADRRKGRKSKEEVGEKEIIGMEDNLKPEEKIERLKLSLEQARLEKARLEQEQEEARKRKLKMNLDSESLTAARKEPGAVKVEQQQEAEMKNEKLSIGTESKEQGVNPNAVAREEARKKAEVAAAKAEVMKSLKKEEPGNECPKCSKVFKKTDRTFKKHKKYCGRKAPIGRKTAIAGVAAAAIKEIPGAGLVINGEEASKVNGSGGERKVVITNITDENIDSVVMDTKEVEEFKVTEETKDIDETNDVEMSSTTTSEKMEEVSRILERVLDSVGPASSTTSTSPSTLQPVVQLKRTSSRSLRSSASSRTGPDQDPATVPVTETAENPAETSGVSSRPKRSRKAIDKDL